jgi:hypothetical protein
MIKENMIQEKIKINLSKGTDIIIKIAGIVVAITALGAGYNFVLNYLWKPKIEILDVNYIEGTATIRVKSLFSQTISINGENIYQIAGEWGIRFGTILNNGELKYNRLELVRKDMVVEYIT